MEYIELVKQGKTSQAALFFIEGELMNVIVMDPDRFNSGDTVICLHKSLTFETNIIKKQENNLYLFVPWYDTLQDSERRRAARVAYVAQGKVQSHQKSERVQLIDLSIKGLGFSCENKLMKAELHTITFTLDHARNHFPIRIQNEREMEGAYRYGVSFIGVPVKDLFYVRRYILNSQLEILSSAAV